MHLAYLADALQRCDVLNYPPKNGKLSEKKQLAVIMTICLRPVWNGSMWTKAKKIIVDNKRTREHLVLSLEEFKKKFKTELDYAFQCYIQHESKKI
ncbi:MAG: hypothetical protein NC218_04515 [Acetobacter sp.]|nr:hypothetical protein [Acetobacter sp.]